MRLARTSSLIAIAFFAFVVAALHAAAYEYYFYWSMWWYDIMMHGLGGLLIGLIAAWAITFPLREKLKVSRFFFIVGVTLFVGILWEVFEYTVGTYANYNSFNSYVFDTMTDIGMDTAGAFVATLLYKHNVYR